MHLNFHCLMYTTYEVTVDLYQPDHFKFCFNDDEKELEPQMGY